MRLGLVYMGLCDDGVSMEKGRCFADRIPGFGIYRWGIGEIDRGAVAC